jgi:hypothetical protein
MIWGKARLNALLDNVLWALVLLVASAVGAALIAFGGQRSHLPVWTVVLFGAALLACVVCVAVLFSRLRHMAATIEALSAGAVVSTDRPIPHPRAGLLRRIDALSTEAAKRDPSYPAEWAAASAFNGILRDAREATNSTLLDEIDELQRGELHDSLAYSATYGTITTGLAQIRAIVQ